MPPLNTPADLILHNARVITLDPDQSIAKLVAVKGDRILWVGQNRDLEGLQGPKTRLIDCQGQTVVPGFIDAHCHLLAYAASLLYLDCGPAAVRSISEIKNALSRRAESVPEEQWVRATGYDEFYLKERRHPNRWDLDEALPRHPVRLNHYSGHACVLNSVALSLAGISSETPDPPDGIIDRDWDTGEPTGLLLEMDSYLDQVVPSLSDAEFLKGVGLANQRLLSMGITSLQDATHSNSPQQWQTIQELKGRGLLAPRVTLMPGIKHLEEFLEQGLSFADGDADLNLGPAKIMLTGTTGSLQPPQEELRELVLQAHRTGYQVAIHAVEARAVEAAIEAIDYATTMAPRPDARHRIEHCSEGPPEVLSRLKNTGTIVVTQPAFLYLRGQRYISEVAPEIQPWLYPIGSLLRSGIPLAFSSDAPVASPDPLIGLYAAVTRQAANGQVLSKEQRVSPIQALSMYTLGGAHAAFQEKEKGSIESGKLADLAVLDGDPTVLEDEALKGIRVRLTVVGGQVAWEG